MINSSPLVYQYCNIKYALVTMRRDIERLNEDEENDWYNIKVVMMLKLFKEVIPVINCHVPCPLYFLHIFLISCRDNITTNNRYFFIWKLY